MTTFTADKPLAGEIAVTWPEARKWLQQNGYKNVSLASYVDSFRLHAVSVDEGLGLELHFAADASTRVPVLHADTATARMREARRARTEVEFERAAADRSWFVRQELTKNKLTPLRVIEQILLDHPEFPAFKIEADRAIRMGYFTR